MTTYCLPNCCNCIFITESLELLAKCDTHNTIDDLLTTARSFSGKFGANPTPAQIKQIAADEAAARLSSSKATLTRPLSKQELLDLAEVLKQRIK